MEILSNFSELKKLNRELKNALFSLKYEVVADCSGTGERQHDDENSKLAVEVEKDLLKAIATAEALMSTIEQLEARFPRKKSRGIWHGLTFEEFVQGSPSRKEAP